MEENQEEQRHLECSGELFVLLLLVMVVFVRDPD